MSLYNANRIIDKSNTHIVNINRLLKNVKSNTLADFIHVNNKEMVITTDKVAITSNLNIIEKYTKNVDDIDMNKVMSSRLPQFKSYLKILGISYHIKDTNLSIILDIIERVIQTTYIFNDTFLASCPKIIKASPQVKYDSNISQYLKFSK